MSELPPPSESIDELEVETAEQESEATAVADPSAGCAICGVPITDTYFTAEHNVLCPDCCERVNGPPEGSRLARFLNASLRGLLAGLVGAAIWFAIRRVTQFELGIVAVLVGYMVGRAVRKGSGDRGGRRYQVLAVVLTYCCIAANYMPDIFEVMFQDVGNQGAAAVPVAVQPVPAGDEADAPGAAGAPGVPAEAELPVAEPPMSIGEVFFAIVVVLVFAFAFSLALPFLGGLANVFGLLIIGFALLEAWRFNARRPLPIDGPYQVEPAPAV